jgi:glucokinase
MRIIGIDIGGTSVKMGILNPDGEISDIRQIDMIPGEPELIIDKISQLAKEFDPDIAGVGTAGAVNRKTGLVNAGNLRWRNVPLRAMLEEKIRKPVWVDNDAQAALMAEWHSGACKGARCAVCITLGTGLGGGLLIDGRPWRGDDNTAFELGQIITNGNAYKNGSIEGRLEDYVSGIALSRMSGGKPAREVVAGVVGGDLEARRVFDIFIHELGIGIVTVMRLFIPEVIVLGGGISIAGEYLLDGILKKMGELMPGYPDDYWGERVKLAVHQNNAGMIGAAALAKLYITSNEILGGKNFDHT